MTDETKDRLKKRLASIGHNGMGLSEKRWSQLESIDRAATLMLERRKEGRAIMKANAITITNIERVVLSLKEKGDVAVSVTDQTMRNGDGLLERYALSFLKDDKSEMEPKEEIRKLKEEIDVLNERLAMMHVRDAEYAEAITKYQDLQKDNEDLRRDKAELVARSKKEGKGHKNMIVTSLDITGAQGPKNLS